MSLDRFIYWNKEKPTVEQIRKLLEDYVSGGGRINVHQTDGKDWFDVVIPGTPQWMFKSVYPNMSMAQPDVWPEQRWFEVCCISIEDNIDVITRQADAYTNAIAEQFARAVAKFYHARYEDPVETIDYKE